MRGRAAWFLIPSLQPSAPRRLLCTDREVFYAVLQRNTADLLPVVYTPTVGDACLQYGTIFPRAPGLFVSSADRGKVAEIVSHWPEKKVKCVVITDGERILVRGEASGAKGLESFTPYYLPPSTKNPSPLN